ncbi:MAG: efflux RND transporter periplasmic adaptor subunit [Chitinophagaceae bacterium]
MKKIFLFLFSLAIVLFSCKDKPKETTTNKKEEETSVVTLTPQQLEKAALQVSAVETKSINSRLQVNGMVDVPPQSMVSVSFPLGGYLKSTKLLPGLEVNKGEVLAVLEDPQFIQLQQDYLMAKSKLAYAEADYNRQKELSTSQAVSEKNLQMAKTEYESQKILVKALEQKLALININPAKLSENNITRSINVYSPIHGFVSKVNVNIGKYVSPTDVLFELVDPSDIHLNLTVFEKDAALLGIEQKVIAYSNNKPDEKHLAEFS